MNLDVRGLRLEVRSWSFPILMELSEHSSSHLKLIIKCLKLIDRDVIAIFCERDPVLSFGCRPKSINQMEFKFLFMYSFSPALYEIAADRSGRSDYLRC